MEVETTDQPYVPVVTPDDFHEKENVVPLFGQNESPIPTNEEIDAMQAQARRKFLMYGMIGVAVGAVATAGMTALALRSYRRTDSVVGPAIYTGIGSAAMGSAMVMILSRVVAGERVDPRVAAMAIGARMAG